ncbi:hypothetical protein PVAG01_05899 [Phlyctema vagabunda]|uniref:Enoyl reductase (ER) domain-containing protein n=1 Tax=Phlyctema vagabunda TaxID=108571 RepID=A0ABR4PEK1_9HELO
MATSKALVTRVIEGKAKLELQEVPLSSYKISETQVLVRVESVAQNPVDGKFKSEVMVNAMLTHRTVQTLDSNAFGEGAVLGCDFVGQVTQVGETVSSLKIGDRIAGLIWGGETKGLGAYSQYTVAEEKICFKVPEQVSPDDAVTVPLAAATAWLALFSSRCLNISRKDSIASPVLIWGGSSSVGQYAIQLARIFSIPVVTVCSPGHFDRCKSLGASYTFDYKDENVVQDIRAAVPDLQHVFDCIGQGSSSTQSSQAITGNGGALCTVRPGKTATEGVGKTVRISDVFVWTAFLKDYRLPSLEYLASEEDHKLATELFSKIPAWLIDGTLVTNTAKVVPGGLESVSEGFRMHRAGEISGVKLVYNI